MPKQKTLDFLGLGFVKIFLLKKLLTQTLSVQ
jgi:hypothetical protein